MNSDSLADGKDEGCAKLHTAVYFSWSPPLPLNWSGRARPCGKLFRLDEPWSSAGQNSEWWNRQTCSVVPKKVTAAGTMTMT